MEIKYSYEHYNISYKATEYNYCRESKTVFPPIATIGSNYTSLFFRGIGFLRRQRIWRDKSGKGGFFSREKKFFPFPDVKTFQARKLLAWRMVSNGVFP